MRALIRTVLVAGVGVALVLGDYRYPGLHYHLAGSTSPSSSTSAAVGTSTRPVTRSTLICAGPQTVGVKGVDTATAAAPTVVRVAAPPADLLAGIVSGLGPGAGSVAASAIGGAGPQPFAPFTAPGTASTQTNLPRSILFSGKGSLAPGLMVFAGSSLITWCDVLTSAIASDMT